MFDIIVVAILVFSFFRGFKHGLIYELAGFATLALGIWGAVKFSGTMEGYIAPFAADIPVPTSLLAFAATLILIIVLVHFVSKLLTKVLDMTILSVPNKLAGGVLRAGRNVFIISSLVGVLERILPAGEGSLLSWMRDGSFTYKYLTEVASFIFPYITEGFDKAKELITQ